MTKKKHPPCLEKQRRLNVQLFFNSSYINNIIEKKTPPETQ